jgi:hypothetical protein
MMRHAASSTSMCAVAVRRSWEDSFALFRLSQRASGGDLLFLGSRGPFLIGPDTERWDKAMLVRQTSVASFLAFARHDAYLAGLGHHTAALEGSRLLPLAEESLPFAAGEPRP